MKDGAVRSMGDGVGSSAVRGETLSEAVAPQVSDRLAGGGAGKPGKRGKRKAAKLRGAWISFTGRILAQFVGSAASILMGIALIHGYRVPVQATENKAVARESAPYEGRLARASEAGSHRRPSIVVLPIDDYSDADLRGSYAAAFTELVTASLAQRGSIVVLSRTSASRIDARHNSVPAIARELGVDLVLESSVTRTPRRIRVVSQLIDGRSDEHLWTGRYDRESGDTLGLQAEIADQIARGIESAVRELPSRPSGESGRSGFSPVTAEAAARAHPVPPADPLSPSGPE